MILYYKKVFTLFLCLLMLVTLANVAVAEEKLLKESWYLVEQQKKPGGYECDQVWQTESGYRYQQDAMMSMSMLGNNPVAVKCQVEIQVDREYLAKSFSIMTSVNQVMTKITGEFFKKSVKVITQTPDGKQTIKVEPLKKSVYFEGSYIEMLVAQGKLKVGKKFNAQIWDLETLATKDYQITVEKQTTYNYQKKAIKVLSILTNKKGLKFLMDVTGEMYWGYDPVQKFTMRKVEKNEIPELKSMEVDVLVVPGNLEVLRPYQTKSSQIQFSWKDLNYKEFNLEDNRQKIISHQVKGKKHEVKVKITQDLRDFTGKVNLPVKQAELDKYLSGGQYLDTESEKIKKLTQTILAGETDGWKATQKLVQWVYRYLSADLTPETLSTEQILERKTGKCVEYAILFTSLARAAGLPTRLALGERYNGNIWVGHMWNEVWLGEWVTIDPSHNQTAPDALLLKFIASDTVLGTQKLRNGLTGNLEIQIIEAKSKINQPNNLKTGITKQSYTNATFSCRVTAPTGYQMSEVKEHGLPTLVIKTEKEPFVQGILVLFSVPVGTSPDQIMEMRIPALEKILPNFILIKKENLVLAQGNTTVGTWTFSSPNGEKLRQENWVIICEDRCFLWVFVAPQEKWSSNQKTFQEILKQFEIL